MAQSTKETVGQQHATDILKNQNTKALNQVNSQNSHNSKMRASIGNSGNMNITPMFMASHMLNRNCPAPQKNGCYKMGKREQYVEESPCHYERINCEKMMRAEAGYTLDNEQLRKLDG